MFERAVEYLPDNTLARRATVLIAIPVIVWHERMQQSAAEDHDNKNDREKDETRSAAKHRNMISRVEIPAE